MWKRSRWVSAGDGAEWEPEQRCGDFGVNSFGETNIRRLCTSEIEEGLPADETARRTGSSTQIDRICLTLSSRVEDEPEEGRPPVAGKISAVRGPHNAVTETITRRLKFYRYQLLSLFWSVKPRPAGDDVVYQTLTTDRGQELIQDDPLIVPGDQAASLLKYDAIPVAVSRIRSAVPAPGSGTGPLLPACGRHRGRAASPRRGCEREEMRPASRRS